jgi:hypothetical protein
MVHSNLCVCHNGQTFLDVKMESVFFPIFFPKIVPNRFLLLLGYFLLTQLCSNYLDFHLIFICVTVRIMVFNVRDKG